MAGSSLFALIDDIAALLDDVAVMSKLAAKKTAGVLGDDLAVNAEKVTGVAAERELPIVWAVAKGSMLNKAILVPAALAISAFIGWAITPLLMIGGAFLCYEGFHKVFHHFFHHEEEVDEAEELREAFHDPEVDLVAFEEEKIKGAVRTDFILSAEIVVIALGTITDEPLSMQIAVLSTVAVALTVGVYGLVAGIVKLDDLGVHLSERSGAVGKLGDVILRAAPLLMKGLSIFGTLAMFLVGGGILAHGLHPVEVFIEEVAHMAGPLGVFLPTALNGVLGLLAGAIVLALMSMLARLRKAVTGASNPQRQ